MEKNKNDGKKKYLINFALNLLVSYFFYNFLSYTYLKLDESEITMKNLFLFYFRESVTYVILFINLFYFVLYYFKFDFVEKMKVNELPWPWEENKTVFLQKLPKILSLYFLNQVILGNLFYFFISFISNCQISKVSMPSFFSFWLQIMVCTLVEDFTFYWSHRTLHHPYFYNKIHKVHHSFYNVIHISYAYAHPLEFVFGNLVPMAMSLFVFQNYLHIVAYTGFVLMRSLETAEGHSGYEFKYSIFSYSPFCNDAEYHDFHHLKNMGNYGSFFSFWDDLFGTNKYFYEKSKVN
jgi:sterol desaturase/sphingolipid hydroxylase (fatty acid hydroxylase superfamily)